MLPLLALIEDIIRASVMLLLGKPDPTWRELIMNLPTNLPCNPLIRVGWAPEDGGPFAVGGPLGEWACRRTCPATPSSESAGHHRTAGLPLWVVRSNNWGMAGFGFHTVPSLACLHTNNIPTTAVD